MNHGNGYQPPGPAPSEPIPPPSGTGIVRPDDPLAALTAENASLRDNLARVTAERDRLLAALQTIAAPGTEHQYSYGVGAEGADYGNGWAVETARAAIAACPPPASGEESE